MTGTVTPAKPLDTFTLTVPKADVSFFRTIAKKMGWTIEHKCTAKTASKQKQSQACLSSTETHSDLFSKKNKRKAK